MSSNGSYTSAAGTLLNRFVAKKHPIGMRTNRRIAISLALVLCIGVTSPSYGEFVVNVTSNVVFGNGEWNYEYRVANDSTEGEVLSTFDFYFAPGANISDIVTPAGWEAFYTEGVNTVAWLGLTDLDVISAGSSLLFGFKSAESPGMHPAVFLGYDQQDEPKQVYVDISAPGEVVPEPSSAWLGLLGLCVFGMFAKMRMRRLVTDK